VYLKAQESQTGFKMRTSVHVFVLFLQTKGTC